MPQQTARRAVIVGGGIAGLGAARRLAARGLHVTLLESAPRLGGCVRSVAFAGRQVDVGAEGLHLVAPGLRELAAELGLEGRLVSARRTVTWIATARGLRPLPHGVGPAGPSRILPLATAGLLGPAGLARAAVEPLVPRGPEKGDVSVAAALTRRFGRQVVDRVVEPLLGGLHAGDLDRLSLRSATPLLAGVLRQHRSVVLAARARRAQEAGLASMTGGLETLFAAAAEQFDGDLLLSTNARAIEVTPGGPTPFVARSDRGNHPADVVVVAAPAAPAATLLASLDPEVADRLAALRAASVAVVLLAYPAAVADLPALAGTGVLVPTRLGDDLKSATFLTTKWPHLDDGGSVLVRASIGRAGRADPTLRTDADLVAAVRHGLAVHAGLSRAPTETTVVRWPRAMPQLEVGHEGRITGLRDRLRRFPGLALAGAAYDGVGLAAALRSGTAAADAALSTTAEDVP